MKSSDPWRALTPKAFEELVYWLLHREGFRNIIWHGVHGADRGRDITCERIETLGPRLIGRKCIVQCKKYSGRISKSAVHADIVKAMQHEVDYFILATTAIVGSGTKDWLWGSEAQLPFKCVLWERTDLDVLLGRHQDVRARFLGAPIEYSYIPVVEPRLSNIAMSTTAREAIAQTFSMALRDGRGASVALLLKTLLANDAGTRSLFANYGASPEHLSTFLDEQSLAGDYEDTLLAAEHTIGEAITTQGLRRVLSLSLSVMNRLRQRHMTQATLLWCMLKLTDSGTMSYLGMVLDLEILRNRLEQSAFTEQERQDLRSWKVSLDTTRFFRSKFTSITTILPKAINKWLSIDQQGRAQQRLNEDDAARVALASAIAAWSLLKAYLVAQAGNIPWVADRDEDRTSLHAAIIRLWSCGILDARGTKRISDVERRVDALARHISIVGYRSETDDIRGLFSAIESSLGQVGGHLGGGSGEIDRHDVVLSKILVQLRINAFRRLAILDARADAHTSTNGD